MRKTLTNLVLALSLTISAIAPLRARGAEFSTPNVTRAEAVMILLQMRMQSVPNVRDTKRFPDVIPGSWYERYVVLGERYGLITADPVSRRLYPDLPVTRAEFLQMTTFAYGLPEGMPYSYRDVRPDAPFAKYAGLAEAYGLFPDDKDKHVISLQNQLHHVEAARALLILTSFLQERERAVTEGKAVAQDQVTYRLQIYQKTSSQSDQVTILSKTPLHSSASSKPKKTPFLDQQSTAVMKAGDDVTQLPKLRAEVLKLVNAERAKAGVPALRLNPTLEASAQIYAEDMASRGYFGHVNPEGTGLRDRMAASGYYRAVPGCPDCVDRYELGENLAQGQLTPAEAVRDWMTSSAHRTALLSPNFSETGIGITAGIWVQHFGGRK